MIFKITKIESKKWNGLNNIFFHNLKENSLINTLNIKVTLEFL